jgi:uncharacterized membrane protein SirB2
MEYTFVLSTHISTVVFTSFFFLVRWFWALFSPKLLQQRWVRILPHVNDSVLLFSGLYMAYRLQQYPFVSSWLTAKFFALLLYIVLGGIALKRGRNRRQKFIAGIAALSALTYLISVALTRNPTPWERIV